MPRQNPLADAVEAALLRSGGPFAFVTNPDGSITSSSKSRVDALGPDVYQSIGDRISGGRRGDRFVTQFRNLPPPAAPAAPAPSPGIRRGRAEPADMDVAGDMREAVAAALSATAPAAAASGPINRTPAFLRGTFALPNGRASQSVRAVTNPPRPKPRVAVSAYDPAGPSSGRPPASAKPAAKPASTVSPERWARQRAALQGRGDTLRPYTAAEFARTNDYGVRFPRETGAPPTGLLSELIRLFGWNEPEGVGRLQGQADEAAARGDALGRATQRRLLEEIARLRAGR